MNLLSLPITKPARWDGRMKSELDSALEILENPVRRRIIRRLSEEPNYPLRLAKELGLGQQLVAKHLSTMEEAGLVASSMEESPRGPRRRTYLLRKSISVTVNVAHQLFSAHVLSFIASEQRNRNLADHHALAESINKTLEKRNKMNYTFTTLLTAIDRRLEKLENQRSVLLYFRHSLVNQAPRMINNERSALDMKHIFSSILGKHSENIRNISKTLNLTENVLLKIIKKLEEDLVTNYLDNHT